MTRRLYLLRHAKSSWDDPSPADHDRPLAGRGRRAAATMAAHLAEHGIAPDLVLCSTSARTRQTLARLELADATVRFERGVYEASAGELLDLLRAVPDATAGVLVIGHNPGLEELALLLARPSAARDDLALKFPTAALATLELDDAWSALAPGRAELTAFVRPRELQS